MCTIHIYHLTGRKLNSKFNIIYIIVSGLHKGIYKIYIFCVSAAWPLLRRRGRGPVDGAHQGFSRHHLTQGGVSQSISIQYQSFKNVVFVIVFQAKCNFFRFYYFFIFCKQTNRTTEMEFLDICFTKDSTLLLYAIHSPFYWQILKENLNLHWL
jgi:hypothetical protein